MALEQILDHALRAVNRLVSQFQESPKVKGMFTALGNETQTLENALWGILVARDLDNANDKTLDNLGALVGAPPRGPKNNTQYRNRVKVQIKANKSYGEDAVAYAIAKLIVPNWNVTSQPRIYEDAHRGYYIRSDRDEDGLTNTIEEAKELARILADTNPAGVKGIVISQTEADEDMFCFAGGPGLGFGDGVMAGAYDGKQ